jgi:two-component sensor histidine kinase
MNAADSNPPEQLLETPHLADALESERFKRFLDFVPFGVAVAELKPSERLVYVNLEFERVTGLSSASVEGKTWDVVPTSASETVDGQQLGDALTAGEDYLGVFGIPQGDAVLSVQAWSNIIADDDGSPTFRLVALVASDRTDNGHEERLQDKDVLLRELQHRVKNNLQMITALIRMEARNLPDSATVDRFNRLAGRIEALALLYNSLSNDDATDSVDLGTYLSHIASSVMSAHAPEGIRLDLKVDTWPASIDVAMPTGLVVNELLTNSLKHAFVGRDGGTITLRSVVEEDGCRVLVADDGIGLNSGDSWPKPGKLSSLIVQSLKQNAKAQIKIETAPGKGVSVTIFFARANAAPSEIQT